MPPEPTTSTSPIKIFGDSLVPGAMELALQRLLSAYRLYDPKISDKVWQLQKTIAHDPQPVPAGKRIWYRNSPAQHGVSGFISLDPGEYSPEEPTGPDDLILDPPPVQDSPAFGSLIWQTLKASEAPGTAQTERLRRYQDLAYRVLDEDSRSYDPGTEPVPEGIQFFQQVAAQSDTSGDKWPQLINGLYDACLFDCRLSVVTFATCMTLLQFQALSNLWIQEPGAFQSPWPSLRAFVSSVSQSEHRPILLDICTQIGGGSYAHGNAEVKSALTSHSLAQTNQHLVLACHNFFTATIVAKLNDQFSLGAKLPYTAVLAEEGFTCTLSGLAGGVDFFLQAPEVTIQSIASSLAAGDVVPAVLRRLSSPVFPVFHNWFARSLIGAARTRAQGPYFDAGLKLLLALETELSQQPHTDNDFEAAWIDQSLLTAYQTAQDTDNAKRYAIRIATRLVLGNVLSELSPTNEAATKLNSQDASGNP